EVTGWPPSRSSQSRAARWCSAVANSTTVRGLASKRSSARAAARTPAHRSRSRCTSARTRLVVSRRARRAAARRNIASASPWRRSRALSRAIQALLSTNSRSGAPRPTPGSDRFFRNERLLEVAVELLAAVGREGVEHRARGQEGILVTRPGEGTNGRPDRLRLRPPALARPRREAPEIPLVEVDL